MPCFGEPFGGDGGAAPLDLPSEIAVGRNGVALCALLLLLPLVDAAGFACTSAGSATGVGL